MHDILVRNTFAKSLNITDLPAEKTYYHNINPEKYISVWDLLLIVIHIFTTQFWALHLMDMSCYFFFVYSLMKYVLRDKM